jgi:hypothetical protein
MKQTAVELLVEEINKLTGLSISMDEPCVEQAKEMEKEQIKSAFTKGDLFAEDYFYPEKPNIDCSENYYNETFKSLEMKKDSNKVTWESPIQAGRFRFKNTKDK